MRKKLLEVAGALVLPMLISVAMPANAEWAGPFQIVEVDSDESGNTQIVLGHADGSGFVAGQFNDKSALYIDKSKPGAADLKTAAMAALLSGVKIRLNRANDGPINPWGNTSDRVQGIAVYK